MGCFWRETDDLARSGIAHFKMIRSFTLLHTR